jgi:hypothetical protein
MSLPTPKVIADGVADEQLPRRGEHHATPGEQ